VPEFLALKTSALALSSLSIASLLSCVSSLRDLSIPIMLTLLSFKSSPIIEPVVSLIMS
jgi:hypothetical protein